MSRCKIVEALSVYPMGRIKFKFAPPNDFGILDHLVSVPDGSELLNPMRVLDNEKGSEVIFSIFQHKGMTDDQFRNDCGHIEKDFKTLKKILEKK